MVILSVRIGGDFRGLGVLLSNVRVMVEEQADHRFRAGQQQAWIQALVEVLFEVAHLAMAAFGQPGREARLLRFEPLRFGKPDPRETEFLGPASNLRHALFPDVRDPAHGVQPASNSPPPAEGTLPRCRYAASVACRPRGVRIRKPS